MKKIWEFLKMVAWRDVLMFIGVLMILIGVIVTPSQRKVNDALKSYGDGVQNHLTWDIKGQCYFVRPNDDVTVYLIRVADCDKK